MSVPSAFETWATATMRRARREQPLELLHTDLAASGRSAATFRRAFFSSQSICQGTMFEWCSSAVMTTSSPCADALPAEGLGDEVDRLGRAADEDDLARSRRR